MESMSAPDGQDQVARAAAGDREALAALWREHRRLVAAVLLAHRPPGADLDDLLQEVAVALVERIQDLREPGKLRPWLRTVAANIAATAARRSAATRLAACVPADPETLEATRSAASEPAAAEEDPARLALDLAGQLPLEYREPLLLRCVQGLSQRAIAEALCIPETTVETRLVRARRMLREALARRMALAGAPLSLDTP